MGWAVQRVGVCGSDVHYYCDGRIGETALVYPATLGHECAGTVIEVGRAVADVRPGDRWRSIRRLRVATVTSAFPGDRTPVATCNSCNPGECPARRPNTLSCPDGIASRFPQGMTFDEAVLVEPLSVGLHAVRLAGLAERRRRRCVKRTIPASPSSASGPSAWAYCCAQGGGPLHALATDLIERRLAVASRCGADWTVSPDKRHRSGHVVAIATRSRRGLRVRRRPGLPRPGGGGAPAGRNAGIGGNPFGPAREFRHPRRARKELRLLNVRRQRGCVAAAIELIRSGRIDARPLLTHGFPLERIGEAFELVAGYRDGVVKAVIDLSA